MIGIHNGSRIFQTGVFVFFQKKFQVFKVIVGNSVAVLVCSSPQDGVSQWVAAGVGFRSAVNKCVTALGGSYGDI